MCDFEQDTPINEPECGYLSEAELDAMTVEELEAALALALDSMTEETYDGDVISRYLDALERKAPTPLILPFCRKCRHSRRSAGRATVGSVLAGCC